MLFGTKLRILKDDFADAALRHRLEELYDTEAAPAEDIAEATVSARRDLSKHSNCPKWCKLHSLRSQIRYTKQSELPAVFLNVVAESFFEDFPDGEIWHLEIDAEYVAKTLWRREVSLAEKYGPSGHKLTADEVDGLTNPVRMSFHMIHNSDRINLASGLGFAEALVSAGISIPLSMTFPYIWGVSVPTSRAVIVFLPNHLVDTWEKTMDPSRLLQSDAPQIYEGTAQSSIGIGVKIPSFVGWEGERFRSDHFNGYLLWYLERLGNLSEFVNGVVQDETAYLLSLSLSRIIHETLIAVTTHMAFVRNQLLYSILDKYANISKGLGLCDEKMTEARLWETYLSRRNLQNRILALVGTIPGVGREFMSLCDDLGEDLETMMGYEDVLQEYFPDVSPEGLLRIVRNSTHGYLFDSERKRRILLCSSGEMSVYLDSASILLWNAFISDPRMFLTQCGQ